MTEPSPDALKWQGHLLEMQETHNSIVTEFVHCQNIGGTTTFTQFDEENFAEIKAVFEDMLNKLTVARAKAEIKFWEERLQNALK